MDIRDQFPSKWLEAKELNGTDKVLSIRDVSIEAVGHPVEQLPVVWFAKFEKGLVLNRTNASTVSELYGPETDEWAGKRITLYATETEFGGRMVPCLRVRTTLPQKPRRKKKSTPNPKN